MPSTKGLTRHSRRHKQDAPQIPNQPRLTPTTTPSTTKKLKIAPATTPSTKSNAVEFRIYQPPSSLRGWADDRELEAPLRYLGLLDVARLQFPTGVPQHHLVSKLISSYDREKRCGYILGTRINVDRKSFLSAISLHPTAERRDLPPNMLPSTVTRAAENFIHICLPVERRDILPPILSAAMREVEAGSPHTVDWGKLMWDLVENEILELPKSLDKISYLGVYLQRLIFVQQPEVFELYEMFDTLYDAALEKVTGRKPSRVGTQPMEVQSSQLGMMLNDGAGLDNSDGEILSSPSNDRKMQIDGCNDHIKAHQRFPEGNQQKQAQKGKNRGVVQSSQLGMMLNDGAGLDNSDGEILSSPPNDRKMQIDGCNDHIKAQQRFPKGNQQKQAQNGKNRGVPTGSAIAIANSSHDIADIERELKNATSKELREAETFIQVVKLLQEKLSPETIKHMFE